MARSRCPITNMLDLVGDKWTLLIVRDMLFDHKSRFGEFLCSDEGIPTNILADRLKRLEAAGVIDKIPYQENPVRFTYTLTGKGRDLAPVLREAARWGLTHIPGTSPDHGPSDL